MKYGGYLDKERKLIEQAREAETVLIPEDIDYDAVPSLRTESRQKLKAQRPRSLGAASRIPGVNPADVAVLMIWLKKAQQESSCGADENQMN